MGIVSLNISSWAVSLYTLEVSSLGNVVWFGKRIASRQSLVISLAVWSEFERTNALCTIFLSSLAFPFRGIDLRKSIASFVSVTSQFSLHAISLRK